MTNTIIIFSFLFTSSVYAAPSDEDFVKNIPRGTTFALNQDITFKAQNAKASVCVSSEAECVLGLHEAYISKSERVIKSGTSLTVKNVSEKPIRIQFESKRYPKWFGLVCEPHKNFIKPLRIENLKTCLGQSMTISYPDPVEIKI